MSSTSSAAAIFPGLVPELLVTDLEASLAFWVGLCGFDVLYDRPAERFAYLQLGSAQLMLEQVGVSRNWVTGALEAPLGRGVNFQISVPAIEPVVERLAHAGWPLFMAPETTWYETGPTRSGVSQFLVQDPDGYLLRLTTPHGVRA
ncbi:glyoxalase [Cryobacterium roopkundense]|uniref:Bleomycin resistance protein n=1 Tax=Cryobacterium roopkundense TaxID=1001240 RepID=A0A099J4A3_9MICO|nr:VOC family protein [Cryobacterium roopkundense]KGJ72915.1 glyoxalase [Cryobacterium roopkundense]MBB5642073.1 catechol 2,3-dioxygenase-like lactoylglutathione lyase family enzyme [Cryobacterium roopkundense]